eukprot:TRINITY_DN538_c0_g1_i9.p1 TRINITY_DN538_c0_g1~~TRINITY_DN538_c0_g1_i9.p1  ORF type:complete len:220 (+),score=16.93 TRINITY_DN538_c0_g1_i9:72-731(+)
MCIRDRYQRRVHGSTKDMKLIKSTSFISAYICAIVVFTLWMIAAHDRGRPHPGNTTGRKCRGCNWFLHDIYKNAANLPFRQWRYAFRDPYVLLVVFGSILLGFWTVTGIVGMLTSNSFRGKIYIGCSVFSYVLFVIFFAITCERSRYSREPYFWCEENCRREGDAAYKWFRIHGNESYVMFWSAGLVCFIIGMYQLASSIVLYNKHLYAEEHPDLVKEE